MTLLSDATTPVQVRRPKLSPGQKVVKIITTTDHKTIGLLYLCTSFAFFLFAGGLAEVIRAELAQPGLQLVSAEQYNQLFTMHGTLMMFLFAPPAAYGFANFIMPLQIGAPDMSFPRLNAFSYWLYLFGGLTVLSGFLTPEGAASFGWFAYAPLNSMIHSPVAGLRPVDHRPAGVRSRHHPGRRQLHHHDHHAARARHDDVPDADLHLEHPGDVDPGAVRLPGPDRRAVRAGGRPAPRRAGLQRRQRRRDPVAAPVLVLRPPRGLHRGAAVLRRHHRDHPGVQPQAAVRLQGPGLRDHRHRRAVADRVGAPHVPDRRGAAAVLRLPELPHRGARPA